MRSPSRTVTSPQVKNFSSTLTSMLSVPQTAGRPMPRATTAACDVFPPRAVKMPCAATIPTRSSGLVSRRTRMTLFPAKA